VTWPQIVEILIVFLACLVVDRAAFWCISNTFGQVLGRRPNVQYANIAFPRLLAVPIGAILTVAGKSPDFNAANAIGAATLLLPIAIMCWKVIQEYRDASGA
jgi:hypothetical protein